MFMMLICVGSLFFCIFLYQIFKMIMIKHFLASNSSPKVTVSAMKVEYANWQPTLNVTGSLRAIRGVSVTTELAGMVTGIYFKPGSFVKEGTVLVQLNADADNAQLQALQASADLAQLTYKRDAGQYAAQAISKAILDNDAADLKNKQAQVAEQAAIVAKKTIRAPFDGRLGISAVNPGQYLNVGDKIVTLQQLNPMYADFYLPQQSLVDIKVGQTVVLNIDTFPGKAFTGKITTIEPIIDVNTRNVEVEATVNNPSLALVPGMFARVIITTSKLHRYLTLPQTAISFNPYGAVIFLVKATGKDKSVLTVLQQFVTTGETRGDQVAVTKGLNEGDLVVTSGQLKLKNGTKVIINNTVVPENNPNPQVEND
ncbi:MAG: efflux RND transporter periplasmic adaptor subunit [Legionellales bacterium]|nr:efflux RND transporter periplasmic adaptor subunit [Legionellales bacterium]